MIAVSKYLLQKNKVVYSFGGQPGILFLTSKDSIHYFSIKMWFLECISKWSWLMQKEEALLQVTPKVSIQNYLQKP